MDEHATAISLLPNSSRIWEVIRNTIALLLRKILGLTEPTCPRSWQDELDKVRKSIRMAENYNDSYEQMVNRIRLESERYQAFKKNPEPIGRVTLNVKQLDSNETCQKQYEVKDPAEGKASVSYTHQGSPDVVLEFVLHDKNDEPLFAVARTYSNWIGYKEFDLGDDRVFYLHMVKDEKPDHVAVQAGFKAKEAAVPVLTFPDAASDTCPVPRKETGSWPFKKMVLVASTHLAVVVLCCSMVKVIANTNSAMLQSSANSVSTGSTAQDAVVPQVMHIVWTNVTADNNGDALMVRGETGSRKDHITSRSNHAAGISTFAVSVNGSSLDESVRCGRELLNQIQKNFDVEARNAGAAESLKNRTCGNTVKFVVSFEPVERKHNDFLFPLGDDRPSFFIGGPDKLAHMLFRIMIGHPDAKSGSDDKESEVAMKK